MFLCGMSSEGIAFVLKKLGHGIKEMPEKRGSFGALFFCGGNKGEDSYEADEQRNRSSTSADAGD